MTEAQPIGTTLTRNTQLGTPDGFQAIFNKTGEVVGFYQLSPPDGTLDRYFTQIYVFPGHRRQGYGGKLYESVMDRLWEKGERLVSDPESFSVDALYVWMSLVGRGKADQYGVPTIDELGDVSGVKFSSIGS